MKVSFVIAAHNEERNILDCVTSIQAEVARAGCDAEIIVVDNASTDATRQKAHALDVVVVSEQRKGLVWARKAGHEASTGDLVAHIDADNRLPVGWLEVVLRTFENKDIWALSGPLVYYDLPRYMRVLTSVFFAVGYVINRIHGLFGVSSMLQGGNFVLRREVIERIGGYDTSISFYGEDTDIGKRVSRVGAVVWTFKLPIYSSGRRIAHEGLIRTGFIYTINFLSVTYKSKPFTSAYTDIRR